MQSKIFYKLNNLRKSTPRIQLLFITAINIDYHYSWYSDWLSILYSILQVKFLLYSFVSDWNLFLRRGNHSGEDYFSEILLFQSNLSRKARLFLVSHFARTLRMEMPLLSTFSTFFIISIFLPLKSFILWKYFKYPLPRKHIKTVISFS